MKTIKLYEAFSGMGAQTKALKNISTNMHFELINLGACDFYIDAIVAYISINYGLINKEMDLSKEQMIEILEKFPFSANSKNIVNKNYFKNINEEKLRKLFPYLYSFVNVKYLKTKIKTSGGGLDYLNSININDLRELPKNIDIFTYSFPCQDISQQGKQKGINENTRSGLLLQVEKILEFNKNNLPKVLLLENVKALTSKKFINQFNEWIKKLDSLGYVSKWKVVNSTEYGSVQNRERVFLVSILKNQMKKDFYFPPPIENKNNLNKIINISNSNKYLDLLKKYKISNFYKTKNKITKARLIDYTNFNSEAYIYLPHGYGPTLTASGANSRLKFYFEENKILRYITSKEAFLYMGFENKDYQNVLQTKLLNESKMLYICGNSISVEVLEKIFEEIIKCL